MDIFNKHVKSSIEYAKDSNQLIANAALQSLKGQLKNLHKQYSLAIKKS